MKRLIKQQKLRKEYEILLSSTKNFKDYQRLGEMMHELAFNKYHIDANLNNLSNDTCTNSTSPMAELAVARYTLDLITNSEELRKTHKTLLYTIATIDLIKTFELQSKIKLEEINSLN